MAGQPFSVAVLSGKGGVGKTTLCLNLARRLSRLHPVWLIDVDLFNRGTTSAIWESEKDLPLSVAELVKEATAFAVGAVGARRDGMAARIRGCQGGLVYATGLAVLPAARAEEGREASYLLWHGLHEQGLNAEDFLTDLLAALYLVSPGCIVMLDGHGGLDELSIGAALTSDVTYIVNEPDLITFTGSITLYHEISRACRERHLEPRIEFIINRVPPNKTILKMEQDFGAVLRTISPAKEPVAAYFPLERELFGVFGDDPFVSEVYTGYWFSRKVGLIAQSLIDHAVRIGRLEARAGKDRGPRESPRNQQKIRTALRREFYKRGDQLLVAWLVFLVVALVANVWSLLQWVLQEGTAKGSPFPGGWTIAALAAAGLVLVDRTGRWFRVQRTHLRNLQQVRSTRRRLRLGESASAQLRESVEKHAKERILGRGLKTAAAILIVLGVLAALLIPNFLDALQKAKQKQTMADVRNAGTAMFSWLTDQVGVLPEPPQERFASQLSTYVLAANTGGDASEQTKSKHFDVDPIPLISYGALRAKLVPQYISEVPRVDGWGHPYEYRLDVKNVLNKTVMSIRSPGRDGKYSGDSYPVESFDPTDYDQDIVWGDGFMVRWAQK